MPQQGHNQAARDVTDSQRAMPQCWHTAFRRLIGAKVYAPTGTGAIEVHVIGAPATICYHRKRAIVQ